MIEIRLLSSFLLSVTEVPIVGIENASRGLSPRGVLGRMSRLFRCRYDRPSIKVLLAVRQEAEIRRLSLGVVD